MKFQDILQHLPKLKKQQLQQLRMLLDSLGTVAEIEPESETSRIVFDLLRSLTHSHISYSNFMKSKSGASYRKHLPSVESFISSLISTTSTETATETTKKHLLRYILSLIYDDLVERQVVPTVGSITQQLGRMADIFESAFPAYRSSRLDSFVVDRILHGGLSGHTHKSPRHKKS